MGVFWALIALLPIVLGHPLLSSHHPGRNSHNNLGLLQLHHNACENPNPNAAEDVQTDVGESLEQFLEHLKEASFSIKDRLAAAVEHTERRVHCANIVEGMRDLDITNFVTIETAMGEYQNDVTRQYFQMRQLLYLFEILDSPQLSECCLNMTRHYQQLHNRLLSKWFILQNSHGQTIEDAHCCLSGSLELNESVNCEIVVRNLVYTILREGITTVDNSIEFLENWIGSIG